MREIKFRVFNGERIIYLASKINDTAIYFGEGGWTAYDHFTGENIELCDSEQENTALMQYTGLKDKNGKEIYEGDIVRILYTDWPSKSDSDPRSLQQYLNDISKIGQIVYNQNEFIALKGEYYMSLHCGIHGFIEVIGNIHENPELL